MPDRIPPILEFPDGDLLWRIEGLGAVKHTEHEPLIEAYLVADSLPLESGRRRVEVGIGQLPYLKTGSHWKNKRLQTATTGRREVLRNVSIREDKIQLIKLGHSFGLLPEKEQVDKKPVDKKPGQAWLIPPFRYPVPRKLADSYCIAIEHGGDPYGILLPAIEAIRFYYAVSTDLAHVMFSGALQLHQHHVIDPEFSGPVDTMNKRMVVALRQWLADPDAWIIGRILGDARAAVGASRIYDSLLAAGANTQQAFPACGLPFEGDTDWTARAIDVSPPGNNQEHKRWLILELEKCTGPFPYEELEVIRPNDNRKADPLTDLPDEEKRSGWAPRPRRADERTGEFQSTEAPRADVQAAVFVEAGARFAAIEGKKIIKSVKEQCRYKSGQLSIPETVTKRQYIYPRRILEAYAIDPYRSSQGHSWANTIVY